MEIRDLKTYSGQLCVSDLVQNHLFNIPKMGGAWEKKKKKSLE